MSVALPTSTLTLGAVLERDRLERRARRIAVAIGVLRLRESEHRREPGAAERRLGQVIADFEAQIEAINRRLRELGTDGPSIQARQSADGHRY